MTIILLKLFAEFACWFVGGLAGMSLIALLCLTLIDRTEKAVRRAYRRDVRRKQKGSACHSLN